jgi:hypothetical protein
MKIMTVAFMIFYLLVFVASLIFQQYVLTAGAIALYIVHLQSWQELVFYEDIE